MKTQTMEPLRSGDDLDGGTPVLVEYDDGRVGVRCFVAGAFTELELGDLLAWLARERPDVLRAVAARAIT